MVHRLIRVQCTGASKKNMSISLTRPAFSVPLNHFPLLFEMDNGFWVEGLGLKIL